MIKEDKKEYLFQYALQTEQDAYDSAVSADQYRSMLNEKILSIHKQFQEKQNMQNSSNSSGTIISNVPEKRLNTNPNDEYDNYKESNAVESECKQLKILETTEVSQVTNYISKKSPQEISAIFLPIIDEILAFPEISTLGSNLLIFLNF